MDNAITYANKLLRVVDSYLDKRIPTTITLKTIDEAIKIGKLLKPDGLTDYFIGSGYKIQFLVTNCYSVYSRGKLMAFIDDDGQVIKMNQK